VWKSASRAGPVGDASLAGEHGFGPLTNGKGQDPPERLAHARPIRSDDEDADGLLDGSGKLTRHIKIKKLDAIPEGAFGAQQLVHERSHALPFGDLILCWHLPGFLSGCGANSVVRMACIAGRRCYRKR